MKTIGISFTKILAERGIDKPGSKAEMNLSFENITKETLDFAKKEDIYSLQFLFKIDYKEGEKTESSISMKGRLLVIFTPSELKEMKKDLDVKSIPIEAKNILFNIILSKCLTKSVFLADELSLPSPLPVPRANLKEKDN